MKRSTVSIAVILAVLISTAPAALAEDVALDRATRVEQIKARWNPVFDQQFLQLTSLEGKAKLDPALAKSYKYLLADFLEVRRVIDAALTSTTGDVEAAASYAEEETGEFAMTIPELAKQIAKLKTITCAKGAASKKVTALKPACPKGYKESYKKK